MDKVIVAHVNEFSEFGVRLLSMYIDMAIENKQKTLPVVIDSYGGEVYSLFAMVDLLQNCGLNIVTICYSKAMSCGAFLFAIGQKRYLSKNATIMIHDAGGCIRGKTPELQAGADEVSRVNNNAYAILDKSCNKVSGHFRNLVKENNNADLYMDASESLNHNLATNLGVPSFQDIDHDMPNIPIQAEKMNDDNYKYKILMQYSKEIDKEKFNFSEKYDNVILEDVTEDNKMDLKQLQEQVSALSTQVSGFQKEASDLRAELKAKDVELRTKESELLSIKSQFEIAEKEVKKVKETAYEVEVTAFVNSLLSDRKITKAEMDNVKADLMDVDVMNSPKILERIKASYSNRSVIGGQELPDFGDSRLNLSSSKGTAKDNQLFLAKAQELKLDPLKPENFEKIFAALDMEYSNNQRHAVFG